MIDDIDDFIPPEEERFYQKAFTLAAKKFIASEKRRLDKVKRLQNASPVTESVTVKPKKYPTNKYTKKVTDYGKYMQANDSVDDFINKYKEKSK